MPWNLNGNLRGPSGAPTPPTTASTSGLYSAVTNGYNVKESQFRNIRAAMGAVASSLGTARIGFLGDSTCAGAPIATAWANAPGPVLRYFLGRDGFTSRGTGLVPCNINYAASEPRITWYSGQAAYSSFSNFTVNSSSVNGVQFDTASTGEIGTVMDVWYADTSAPFDVNIDGGAKVRITPTGTQTVKCYTVTGLSNATHQAIAWRVSGSVYILGFQLRANANYGLEIYKAGISGAKTDSLASTDWTSVVQTVSNPTSGWDAHLAVITCSTNDMGAGTSSSIFKTNMQTAINTLKTNKCDILLTTGNVHQTGDFTPYTKALYELADSNDLPLLDTQARWGSWANANALGQMQDAAHPNAIGYADLGRALKNVLPL